VQTSQLTSAILRPKTDTKETQHIPYGLCIWSTGIGTSPLINKIREKLPQDVQTNRRALLTDQFLHVKVPPPDTTPVSCVDTLFTVSVRSAGLTRHLCGG
jgi:hypothetical protein